MIVVQLYAFSRNNKQGNKILNGRKIVAASIKNYKYI
jgi:hypothetical protein